MKYKPTISVAIPAYNEEYTIQSFLQSVLTQRLKAGILKEVIVYSDASSDKTESIVENLAKKNKLVTLIKGKERKGKYARVNELFARSKSDVLFILDADIALKRSTFLETITRDLISDTKAAMMSAHIEQVKPEGLIGWMLYTNFVLGDYMRLSVPRFANAANFHGAATAYKKSFYSKVNIPDGLSDPHLYIYLQANKIDGFRYNLASVILQHPPATMTDIRQLMQRTIGKKDKKLEKIFGKEVLLAATTMPTRAKIQGLLTYLLDHPFTTPVALCVMFYLAKVVHPKTVDTKPVWKINQSTKKPIPYSN